MANDLINGDGAGKPAPEADTSLWMYRGQEGRLFARKEDVPEGEGWKDAPYDLEAETVSEPEKPVKRKKKTEAEPVADEAVDGDGN
jgi:hypothetical protein